MPVITKKKLIKRPKPRPKPTEASNKILHWFFVPIIRSMFDEIYVRDLDKHLYCAFQPSCVEIFQFSIKRPLYITGSEKIRAKLHPGIKFRIDPKYDLWVRLDKNKDSIELEIIWEQNQAEEFDRTFILTKKEFGRILKKTQ